MADDYIFHDAADAAELERLRLLESVCDEKTQHWLRSEGPLAGRRCLEVGAGAGSIAAWLAAEVRPTGHVTAIDTNVRFLRSLAPGVEVIEGEVGGAATLARSFDVVHARYVLIHNADAASVLDAMLGALAPGGVLVLEEPDFSAARAFTGPPESRRAFDAVQRALGATFAGRNMNSAFGALLPALLEERGAKVVSMEYDCPVVAGGSPLAEMMRLSTLALAEKYVATGFATPDDLAGYAEFAATPACRATYYASVRVIARRDGE